MTNNNLIKKFIDYLKKQGKSNSTIIAYKKDLEQLSDDSGQDFSKIVSEEIAKFIKALKFTPKTVSRKLNSIRTFFKFLVETKVIVNNPALAVPHPKFKSTETQEVLSPIEYLALRQVSKDNQRLHTMIELMLQTGIRIGELSRIKIGDIDIKKTKGYLTIEPDSTNEGRTIELNSSAINLLQDYLKLLNNVDDNTPLFATRDGKHIIIRNIRSSIDRAIDKSGIKNACVNDLRNTFIVHQLSQGVPIERITSYVGHKSKTTTSRYLELLDNAYQPKTAIKIVDL